MNSTFLEMPRRSFYPHTHEPPLSTRPRDETGPRAQMAPVKTQYCVHRRWNSCERNDTAANLPSISIGGAFFLSSGGQA